MPQPQLLETADPAALSGFHDIIDVRSPAEFAEDHVPGAINLPVLSNEERAVVGTIYVQESAFRARKIGAALVARNVAHHLDTALADRPADYRPLVYCWRGGQRSNAMATILGQIGWRVAVLKGGYKTYRRRVQARLYDEAFPHPVILLDGGTGAGKTEVLRALVERGVQTLDLEALAEHRGSLFGGRPGGGQPSQKMFESRLLAAVEPLDPARPVLVEAESHKIGERMIPPSLWKAMADAPAITLSAPRAERARYLVTAYADLLTDPEALKGLIARLPVHIGGDAVKALIAYVDAGDFQALAEDLIALHYDPAYARSTRERARTRLGEVTLPCIDPRHVALAADAVAALVEQNS